MASLIEALRLKARGYYPFSSGDLVRLAHGKVTIRGETFTAGDDLVVLSKASGPTPDFLVRRVNCSHLLNQMEDPGNPRYAKVPRTQLVMVREIWAYTLDGVQIERGDYLIYEPDNMLLVVKKLARSYVECEDARGARWCMSNPTDLKWHRKTKS